MTVRLIGAGILCLGSVYIGFSAADAIRKTLKDLQQLKLALEMMHCEVSFALTPLGTLCEILSNSCTGDVSRFFRRVQGKLTQSYCEPKQWITQEVNGSLRRLPAQVRDATTELMGSFGRFGAPEQLRLIELTTQKVDAAISELEAERSQRCKCYRTLGICTGLAVAILVI